MVLDELEGHGQVVILQHGLIIVDQRQLGAGVDQVLVGHPRVVHIVYRAGQDRRQHLDTSVVMMCRDSNGISKLSLIQLIL